MDIVKIIRYPVWLAAFLARFAFMMAGAVMAPLTLLGDGQYRTQSMWRWLVGNVEDIPNSWEPKNVPAWSYAYLPLMIFMVWFTYDNWHPLWTIYFVFASVGPAGCVFSKDRWAKFWWMAIRNPIEGLDSTLEQPSPERKPNPDELVRGNKSYTKKATRFTDDGLFWEYWSLSRIESGPFKGRYWENRIGWKYVDGNEDFVPTIQIGPKK